MIQEWRKNQMLNIGMLFNHFLLNLYSRTTKQYEQFVNWLKKFI